MRNWNFKRESFIQINYKSTLLAFSLNDAWGDSEHFTTTSLFSVKYDATCEKVSSSLFLRMASSTQTAFMRTYK